MTDNTNKTAAGTYTFVKGPENGLHTVTSIAKNEKGQVAMSVITFANKTDAIATSYVSVDNNDMVHVSDMRTTHKPVSKAADATKIMTPKGILSSALKSEVAEEVRNEFKRLVVQGVTNGKLRETQANEVPGIIDNAVKALPQTQLPGKPFKSASFRE